MSTDKLKNILIQRERSESLPHFYTLYPGYNFPGDKLLDWTQGLISSFEDKSSIQSSEDVLIITDEDDQKQYKAEVLSRIFDFTKHPSLSLKRKYLIIDQMHKLTAIHSNKLLKTFEEPPINLVIFALNANKAELLPTIESRTIKLRVGNKLDQIEPTANWVAEFIDSKDTSFQLFVKYCKDNKLSSSCVAKDILALASKYNLQELDFNAMKKAIEQLSEDITYNNSQQSQLHKLFQCIQILQSSRD